MNNINRQDTATVRLGTEKISTLLLRYAIPSIIAMTAASLYNIADSIFIGHGVGPLAISALAITLPLMNLAAAFGAMVGIGASSLLSIKLGQNDVDSAKAILGNTLLLNLVFGIGFGAICFILLDPILYSFGASEDTIDYCRDYMRILLAGNVFTHIYLGLNNVLRATGRPVISMVVMIIAVVLNCILDAIFIFGFGWGIAGAAWATVIAQFVAMVIQLVHFSNKNLNIHFERVYFKFKAKIVRGILGIGLAPFLMNISASIVVIFINNALKNNGGDLYIGAYGIMNRVAIIFTMIVFGLNQGMQPIVGYNYGAHNFDRVRRTFNLVVGCAVTVTTTAFLAAVLFPKTISMIFTTDPVLLRASEEGMRIVFVAFPIVGFQIVVSSFFQSIGMPNKAILLSLSRQLLFLIPLLIFLPPVYGSKGVWMSMPIADCVSTVIAVILLVNQIRTFKKGEKINSIGNE